MDLRLNTWPDGEKVLQTVNNIYNANEQAPKVWMLMSDSNV